MKTVLKLEEAAMFGAAIYAFSRLSFAWWWFPLLILAPDIGMVGYLFNNKIGAFFYNLFHHKGLAIIIFVMGLVSNNEVLQLSGVILFGHSSMDRMLGYGLKYETGFKKTHLGLIGN
jgi:hypothetical protein